MAYSELIKNFDRIRYYMRQFYVYGFKSRTEYDNQEPPPATLYLISDMEFNSCVRNAGDHE